MTRDSFYPRALPRTLPSLHLASPVSLSYYDQELWGICTVSLTFQAFSRAGTRGVQMEDILAHG
jgi:hypothetical protein